MTVKVEHKEYYGGIKGLSKRAKGLAGVVKVGVLTGTGEHPNSDGALISEIAHWMEFGTIDIPARPFMRTAIGNHMPEYVQITKDSFKMVQKDQMSPKDFHGIIGEKVKSDIQREIVWGFFEPNALSTILAKNSSRPLVDTGIMRQSISWEVDFKALASM